MKKQYYVYIFFISYFIFGTLIFKDYGVPWDEGSGIKNALINSLEINKKFNYVILSKEKSDIIINKTGQADSIVSLEKYKDKDYGSINEVLITLPSMLIKNQSQMNKVIYIRHFCVFVFFWISSIYFYLLLKLRYNNQIFSLIGTFFYIFSPRIFADSFYNSKDILLLSFFIITIYYSIKFIQSSRYKNLLLCAVFSSIAIAVRIPAIILPVLTFAFFLIKSLLQKREIPNYYFNIFTKAIIFIISICAFTYIFWPYLWSSPINNFILSFENMKKFRWIGGVLFEGSTISGDKLPWYYIFKWILISTPIYYSIFFIVGIIVYFKILLKLRFKVISNFHFISDSFLFLMFITPILAVIIFHSVLYNGWRHLYFTYPAFLYMSVLGADSTYKYFIGLKSRNYMFILRLIIIYCLGNQAYIIFKYHPYEMVYFNFLAGNNIENKFEIDYWGLSFREGFEYLLKSNNSDQQIKIFDNSNSTPIKKSIRILMPNQVSKITFTSFNEADFFMTCYNDNSREELMKKYNFKKEDEIYKIVINGIKIFSIYKINHL